jgi:hypothetical protein
MKPKPFSSLNHLTVPVAMQFLRFVLCCDRGGASSNVLQALALRFTA